MQWSQPRPGRHSPRWSGGKSRSSKGRSFRIGIGGPWRSLRVGLGVGVDTRDPTAIAATAGIFGVAIPLLTVWIAFGGRRHVKVHERLLGSRGAGLIVGFVWLVVGGTLGLAFALQAANVRSAGTLSTLACAIVLVVGGPALMRRLREIMRRQAGVG